MNDSDVRYVRHVLPKQQMIVKARAQTAAGIKLSAYVQDKIELNELIINLGVRLDYFDPKGKMLSDPSDPSIYNPIKPSNIYEDSNENGVWDNGENPVSIAKRRQYWFKDTNAKWKISPRFGASFPFSATDDKN